MVKRKAPQHVLTLSGISASEIINLHFGSTTTRIPIKDAEIETNLDEPDLIEMIENIKDLEAVDISHENDRVGRRALHFFDSKKKKIKLWPVMIDITQKGSLPLYTSKPCRNCHHQFNTHPIGCPIHYNPNITDKKDIRRIRVETFLAENNLPTDTNDFFETENLFCSWPCVKSYVFSCLSKNPHSHRYKNSLSYITMMYRKIHGTENIPKIPTAAPLGVIDAYGGHLSIDEYRASFGVLNYEETINVRRPYMYSSSAYIEESHVKL